MGVAGDPGDQVNASTVTIFDKATLDENYMDLNHACPDFSYDLIIGWIIDANPFRKKFGKTFQLILKILPFFFCLE